MAERPEVTFNDALYDTDLIDSRWKQRRCLRFIPDEFVQRVYQRSVAPPAPKRADATTFDPRLAELQARGVARGLQIALSDRLVELANAVRLHAFPRMFDEWGSCNGLLDEQGPAPKPPLTRSRVF